MKKRLLSLIMALALVIGVLPCAVSAAGDISVTVRFSAPAVAEDLAQLRTDLLDAGMITEDDTNLPSDITVTVPSGSTVKTVLETAQKQQNFTIDGLSGADSFVTKIGFLDQTVAEYLVSSPSNLSGPGWSFFIDGTGLSVGVGTDTVSTDGAVVEGIFSVYSTGSSTRIYYDVEFMNLYHGLDDMVKNPADTSGFSDSAKAAYDTAKSEAEVLLASLYSEAKLDDSVAASLKDINPDFTTDSGMWIGFIDSKNTSLYGTDSPIEQLQKATEKLEEAANSIDYGPCDLTDLDISNLEGTAPKVLNQAFSADVTNYTTATEEFQTGTACMFKVKAVAEDSNATIQAKLNDGAEQTLISGSYYTFNSTDGGVLQPGTNNKLVITVTNDGDFKEYTVTIPMKDAGGNTPAPDPEPDPDTPDAQAVMDAIAGTLTESSDEWTVMDMALYQTLDGKTAKTTAEAKQNALNKMISEAAGKNATAGDRARLELVLRAIGTDSTKLYPANSNTAVNNADKLAKSELTAGGYYAAPWILLAELQGNLKLTNAQRQSLITLLKDNMGNGLFGYEWEGVAYSDPDTAGSALAALAPYYDSSADAKTTVDAILAALPGGMNESGSFGSANSDAMVIIGLIAMGEDPAELKAASGASVADGLLSYVNKAGNGFTYAGTDNALATEQGFRALIALAKFDGSTPCSIYDFHANAAAPGRATGSGKPSVPGEPDGEGTISVTLTLKTDTQTWINRDTLELKTGSTVYHALREALNDNGMSASGMESGYVKSVSKDGVTLSEFDKGENSGWLYKVNGDAPNISMTEYTLEDKDSILWYYTLDWTKDPSAGNINSGGNSGGTSEKPAEGEKATTELRPEATANAGGEASAAVTDKQLSDTIAQAKTDKADIIVITPDVKGEASRVSVELPKSGVDDIARQTGAALKVDTGIAAVTIPQASLNGLAQSEGRTVTVSAEAVKDTENIKLEVAVDGKSVEKLTGGIGVSVPSKDENSGNVLVIVKADGSETIVKKSVVDGKTVAAVLDGSCTVKIMDNSKSFADTESHWSKEAVAFASSHELFNGVADDTFAPDAAMSRAMLATVLYRLEDASASGGNPFNDVSEGAWYTDAVVWASTENIVSGTGDGFAPDRDITRQELVTMLYRYAESVGMDTAKTAGLNGYTDSGEVADWAGEAMSWAVGNGLVSGRTSTTLAPTGTATRAEVAAVIQRLVEQIVR